MAKVALALEDAPIFEGLSQDELTSLAAQIAERRFQRGENLLEFGWEAPGLFVIRSGLVSAIVGNESGREREVATLGRGECVGEMALMTGEPCSATVRALTDVEAWLIGREQFIEIFERSPMLWRNLGRILSQRLARTSRHLSTQAYANTVALVFDCGADEAAAMAVAVAGSLARQTGKRTLLVDARGRTPCPVSTLAAAALSPSLAEMLRERNLLKRHQAPQDRDNGMWGARIADLADEGDDVLTEDEYVTVMDWLAPLYDFVLMLMRPEGGMGPFLRERTRSVVALLTDHAAGVPAWLDGLCAAPEGRQKLEVAMLSRDPRAATVLEHVEDRTGKAVVRLPVTGDELRMLPLTVSNNPSGRLGGSIDRLARQIGEIEIGLALGAGAAKGFAHIGVLRVLEEESVPIDYIAGCSIGSVVGAMYALGLPLAEIEARMNGADRKLKRWTLPFRSLWSDAGLKELLRNPAPAVRFRDLSRPFVVVATDVVTGRETPIRKGLVWRAVQASTSVPGIFPAVALRGRHLVDGGLVNPVPSQTVRQLGADIVIAVDLMSPAAEGRHARASRSNESGAGKARLPNLVEMLWRANEIMQEEVTLRSAATADITIAPKLGQVRWSDFSRRGKQFIALGEQAAREKITEIQRLLPYLAPEGVQA